MLAPRPKLTQPLTKKHSGDSGVGSSRSSGAWSTREARLRAPTTTGPSSRALGQTTDSRATQSRRASARVQRWLNEQSHHLSDAAVCSETVFADAMMTHTSTDTPRIGTPANPYLAYAGVRGCSIKPASVRDSGYGDNPVSGSGVLDGGAGTRQEYHAAHTPASSVTKSRKRVDYPGLGLTQQKSKTDMNKQLENEDESDPHLTKQPSSSLRAPRPRSVLSIASWRGLSLTKSLPHRGISGPQEDNTVPEEDAQIPATGRRSPKSRKRSPIPDSFREVEGPQEHSARNKASSGTLRAADMLSTPTSAHPPRSLRQKISNLVHVGPGPVPDVVTALDMNSPRPSTSTSSATTATTAGQMSPSKSKKASGNGLFALSLSRGKRGISPSPAVGSPSRSTFSMSTHTLSTNTSAEGTGNVYGFGGVYENEYRATASSSALSSLSIGSIGTLATSIGSGLGIHGGYSLNGPGLLKGTNGGRRKKRLVVGGIGSRDTRSIEGLRQWCERFGEVKSMTRGSRGEIIVDFRRADVADTVCRVSARVHIPGVGSVQMSWTTAKKC